MQNRNFSISQDLNRIFDLKGESTDYVSDVIMPVVPIQRICNIVRRAPLSNATSATVYTTPSDKDFYLNSAFLSVIKDVTAQSLASSILVFIDSVQVGILSISGLSLTPQNDVVSISFPIPLKLDRNTTITVTASNATANVSASAGITGYTVETTK